MRQDVETRPPLDNRAINQAIKTAVEASHGRLYKQIQELRRGLDDVKRRETAQLGVFLDASLPTARPGALALNLDAGVLLYGTVAGVWEQLASATPGAPAVHALAGPYHSGTLNDFTEFTSHTGNADAHHAAATGVGVITVSAGQAVQLVKGDGLVVLGGALYVGQGDGIGVDASSIRVRRAANSGLGLDAGGALQLGTPISTSVSSANTLTGVQHSHAIDWSSAPGAVSKILGTSSVGYLTLVRAIMTDRLRTPLIDTATGNLTLEPAGTLVQLAAGKGARSWDFASGFTGYGWQVDDNILTTGTSFEVDNLTVRGTLRVYELLIQQIRATNGSIFVSSVAKIEEVVNNGGGSYTLTVEGDADVIQPFAVNDLIRAQRVRLNDTNLVYRCDMTVTAINVGGNTRKFTATLRSGSNPPTKGMDFVRLGNTTDAARRGVLYLTSDDSGAPFMDVVDGIAAFTDWNTPGKIKARLGRITGITGVANEYGFIAGADGYSDSASYIKASNLGIRLNNVDLQIYSGTTLIGQLSKDYGLALLQGASNEDLPRSVTWHTAFPATLNNFVAKIGAYYSGSVYATYLYGRGYSNKPARIDLTAYTDSSPAVSVLIESDPATFKGTVTVAATDFLYYPGGGVYHKIWHAGNDGDGSGLDADLVDGIDSAYLNRWRAYGWTALAGTWYRIARTAQGGGRGPGRILLLAAGGTSQARIAIIDLLGSWGDGSDTKIFIRTNAAGQGWTQYRISSDGVYRYLEAYFSIANTYYVADIFRLHYWDSWYAIQPVQAPGGGIELAAFDDYEINFHNQASFRINGYDVIPGGWQAAAYGTTLDNNWAAFGAPYRAPVYRRVGDIVMVSGMVKNGTGTPGNWIMNLPAGYRPGTQLIFGCMSYLPSAGTNISRRIDVKSNGDVVWAGWTPENGTWVSLEIVFSK